MGAAMRSAMSETTTQQARYQSFHVEILLYDETDSEMRCSGAIIGAMTIVPRGGGRR
jgi:hypothetical protein